MTSTPRVLRIAAAILGMEGIGMLVATGFSAAATVSGKSYQTGSGIALTAIAFGVAVAVAAIGNGLRKTRLWSRTPALLVQLFAAGAGLYLIDGNRLEWGVPAMALAAVALVALFTPASFRALNREPTAVIGTKK